MKRRGFLVILSGPSSAGKNTLLSAIKGRVPGMLYSISVTTRKPRPGERHGVDYFFLDDAEFTRLRDSGGLLEWAEYCGHYYGTPREFVEDSLAAGHIVITDIDIQGARQIRTAMPEAVAVFLMPPSLEELQKRIVARGTDSEAAIKERMKRAVDEMKYVVDYDYWILNTDLDQAVTDLLAIITAERQRVERTEFP
ncbi:MAG TPA: guanylate kinase [Firmicutes bacterium]|jgi:guanylate kinase|nr:guanylate kinase [Bacillota bacterium]